MTMMRINVMAAFKIERRTPTEFNMAQIWHEFSLICEEKQIKAENIKSVFIKVSPMSYDIDIVFDAVTNLKEWRGFYGSNPST